MKRRSSSCPKKRPLLGDRQIPLLEKMTVHGEVPKQLAFSLLEWGQNPASFILHLGLSVLVASGGYNTFSEVWWLEAMGVVTLSQV